MVCIVRINYICQGRQLIRSCVVNTIVAGAWYIKMLMRISFLTQVRWIKVETVLMWPLFPPLDMNVSSPLKRRAGQGLEIWVDQP